MRTLLRKYIIATMSIFLVSRLRLGLLVTDSLNSYLYAGLILFILLLLKPFIDTLLFPLHLITLNLSNWLTYLALIYFWSLIIPQVKFLTVNFSDFNLGPLTVSSTPIPYWLSVIIMSLSLVLTVKFFTWLVK